MTNMDCNKDEAIRAKELAEKKFAEKDFAGAKYFALKAENLYPKLDGLPQLLSALDVCISADRKIDGEVDWYKVLGVGPHADEDTIRKHYRKLALILHPDKNKSVGADRAFTIISEAWMVLSDKTRRFNYDHKRNLRGIYMDVFPGKSSTETTSFNGFRNFQNGDNSNTVGQHGAACSNSAPPHLTRNDTFWTICNFCKIHFEYYRVYINANVPCVNCQKPFHAVATSAPPTNDTSKYTPLSDFMQQNKLHQVPNEGLGIFSGSSSSTSISQKDAFLASNINMPPPASSTAQAPGVTHSASKTLKRNHKESQTGTGTNDILQMGAPSSQKTQAGLATGSLGSAAEKKHRRKKRRVDATAMGNPMAMGNEGAGPSSFQKNGFEIGRTNVARISSNSKPPGPGIRDILMEMVRKEIHKKANSGKPTSLPNASNKPKVSDEDIGKKDEGNGQDVPSEKPNAHKTMEFGDIKSSIQPKISSVAGSDVDPARTKPELMSMNVPDPDFHDFDQDRTEKSFGENQVWAAYDDNDGMPRFYAMIHSVISLKPFKMRMSWLNSKSNAELAPLNWIGSGFYKTSGVFWVGKYEVNRSLNSFSHKVKWSKGRKGTIQIYPRKGDVWALYRNWSSNWDVLTPVDVIHKYDMVEVLEDYNEQNGVVVIPLVKVPGFKTVFRKHWEPSKTLVIQREELFRLSHQVPSYLLTGQEGQKSCKGCLELDPAAIPKELLQVLTEEQVKEMESVIEDAPVVDSKRSKGKELAENDHETEPNFTGEGVGEDIEKEKENNGEMESVIEDASVVDSKRSKGKELAENDHETEPKFTGEGVGGEDIEKENNELLVYGRRQAKYPQI